MELFEMNFFDVKDPYEKIIFTKRYPISEISDVNWDENGHVWFNYKNKEVFGKGDIIMAEQIFRDQQK